MKNKKQYILDGKREAKRITKLLNHQITKLSSRPTLAVIIIGNDPASQLYVSIKQKKAKELGINFKKFELSTSTSEKKVLDLILKLNQNKKINGIMIQLPLPKKFNTQKIISAISLEKDVDGLLYSRRFVIPAKAGIQKLKSHYKQISPLLKTLEVGRDDRNIFIPPTIQSILHLIKLSKQKLKNKNAIIFCNSQEFGESLKYLLEKKFKSKKVIINLDTPRRVSTTFGYDLIITAKGKKHFIKPNQIKKNSVIIDVGINKDKNNKICGDVDPKCFTKTKYISPVPGGVGPLTVIFLFKNLFKTIKK